MSQDILNLFLPALGLFILLVVSGNVLLLIPKRKKAREKVKIKNLQDKIQAVLDDIPAPGQTENFAYSLSSASLNTRLQKPKLKLQSGIIRDIPEKYKISAKMASRGMAPDEIASILDISSAEASQLVHLCQVTGARGFRGQVYRRQKPE